VLAVGLASSRVQAVVSSNPAEKRIAARPTQRRWCRRHAMLINALIVLVPCVHARAHANTTPNGCRRELGVATLMTTESRQALAGASAETDGVPNVTGKTPRRPSTAKRRPDRALLGRYREPSQVGDLAKERARIQGACLEADASAPTTPFVARQDPARCGSKDVISGAHVRWGQAHARQIIGWARSATRSASNGAVPKRPSEPNLHKQERTKPHFVAQKSEGSPRSRSVLPMCLAGSRSSQRDAGQNGVAKRRGV
jgi:hypothetical protein